MDLLSRKPLAELSPDELLARAADYRKMAATATTTGTRDALLRIAKRFSEMALDRSCA